MSFEFNREMIEIKAMHALTKSTPPKIDLPVYASSGAAAMDLRACIEDICVIYPGERKLIPTGYAFNINDVNVVGYLTVRSSLGLKHGISLANDVGIIDSDYQGDVGIILMNNSNTTHAVKPNERIAQITFGPVIRYKEIKLVEEFSHKTERGEGGFGSTGSL